MKIFKGLVLISGLLLLASCSGGGAEKGFAPGVVINPSPVSSPTSTTDSHIKYGETVSSTTNWTVSSDTTDPVEHKQLSNGWTVEVKY